MCPLCRTRAHSTRHVRTLCRTSAHSAGHVPTLQDMCPLCRTCAHSAGHVPSLQEMCTLCRTCAHSAGHVHTLQDMCPLYRTCAHSAGQVHTLQDICEGQCTRDFPVKEELNITSKVISCIWKNKPADKLTEKQVMYFFEYYILFYILFFWILNIITNQQLTAKQSLEKVKIDQKFFLTYTLLLSSMFVLLLFLIPFLGPNQHCNLLIMFLHLHILLCLFLFSYSSLPLHS